MSRKKYWGNDKFVALKIIEFLLSNSDTYYTCKEIHNAIKIDVTVITVQVNLREFREKEIIESKYSIHYPARGRFYKINIEKANEWLIENEFEAVEIIPEKEEENASRIKD